MLDIKGTINIIVLSVQNRDQTMNQEQAIEQIEQISQAMRASNRIFFSGSRLILNGILIALIPLIEYIFAHLVANQISNVFFNTIAHIVFYWLIFAGANYGLSQMVGESSKHSTHPLIRRALSVKNPILVTIFGSLFVMIPSGYGALVYPFVYLLIGIFYNLLGKFSSPILRYVGWSYTILGLVYAYMTQFHWPYLWMVFTTYMGLSYIVMGIFLNKKGCSND